MPTEACAKVASPEMRPPARKRPGIVARMLHGTGAGAVATALGIATNLLLLPLYLHRWSVAVYGEWMALYSIVNYLGTLDFGVSTAAINAATMAYARKDWDTFKRVQGTAWAASMAIALLGVLGVAAMLFFFRVNQLLGLKAIGTHEARIVFASLAVALLASIPGRQLGGMYIALGEFAKYQWLYNLGTAVSCIATAAALCLGAGPAALAVLIAVVGLVNIAFIYALIWHRDARLVPRVRDAEWATARSLAAPTGQFGMQMVSSALTVQGPIVILVRVLGGPAVALFTTTRTVANVVAGILMVFRAPLGPEFAAAHARASKEPLRQLFRMVMAADSVVATALGAGLWSGGSWLIRFWSHGRIVPDSRLLHLLLALALLEGFVSMLSAAGRTANRFHGVTLGTFAYAAFSLILAAVLVPRLGPSAVPMAGICAMALFFMPSSLRNAKRETELPLRTLFVKLLLPFAIAVFTAGGLAAAVVRTGIRPEWLAGCASALATGALAAAFLGMTMLTGEDRRQLCIRIEKWGGRRVLQIERTV